MEHLKEWAEARETQVELAAVVHKYAKECGYDVDDIWNYPQADDLAHIVGKLIAQDVPLNSVTWGDYNVQDLAVLAIGSK